MSREQRPRRAVRATISALVSVAVLAPGLARSACEDDLAALRDMREQSELSDRQVGMLESMLQSGRYLCDSGQEAQVRKLVEQAGALLQAIEQVPAQVEAASERAKRQRRSPEPDRPAQSVTTTGPERVFDRPEDMFQYWFKDIDRHGAGIRVLYSTSPSLPQGRSGNWTVNVYLVEGSADGTFRQHRLYSKKAYEHTAMALRPGRDEVLVQRRLEDDGAPVTLELWSLPEGKVLSSTALPSPFGGRFGWSDFRDTTLDGNVFFTVTTYDRNRRAGAGAPESTAAWFEFSPEGRVIGKGRRDLRNARQQIRHWFPAHTGGAGMTVHTFGQTERGLSDVLDESYAYEIGGRGIEGVVSGELRLAVTDADTSDIVPGPALEREIRWIGEMSADRDLPVAEKMRQSQEQMAFMRRTEAEAGARRNVEVVKPIPGGYGALVRNLTNKDDPDFGFHFIEVTTDGLRRDIPVEPLADRFDVKFENFAAAQDDVVYLFGRAGRKAEADARIVVLDGDADEARAISIDLPDGTAFDEILADESGLWIAGHVMNDSLGAPALWLRYVPL